MPKQIFLPCVSGIICLIPLLIAYYTEIFLQYVACSLCIYQRIPFVIALVFSISAIFFAKIRQVLLPIVIILFAINMGVAFYHIGVENAWFEALSSCSIELEFDTIEDLQNHMRANNQKSCSDITGRIFGISMAIANFFYNLLCIILMMLIKFKPLAIKPTYT